MSRKSNGLDNMVTERFFRHLKVERVNYRRYEIGSQDIADVIYYIGRLYNLKRRHYQLGSISPDEYECRLQQYAKLVSVLVNRYNFIREINQDIEWLLKQRRQCEVSQQTGLPLTFLYRGVV